MRAQIVQEAGRADGRQQERVVDGRRQADGRAMMRGVDGEMMKGVVGEQPGGSGEAAEDREEEGRVGE
jgi:hypothetical protein